MKPRLHGNILGGRSRCAFPPLRRQGSWGEPGRARTPPTRPIDRSGSAEPRLPPPRPPLRKGGRARSRAAEQRGEALGPHNSSSRPTSHHPSLALPGAVLVEDPGKRCIGSAPPEALLVEHEPGTGER